MVTYPLKLTQNDKKKVSKRNNTESCMSQTLEPTPPKKTFPNAVYFQIHFENLQKQFKETNTKLEELQQQIYGIQNQLSKTSLDSDPK